MAEAGDHMCDEMREALREADVDFTDWLERLHELATEEGTTLALVDEEYRPNWETGQTPEEVIEDEEDAAMLAVDALETDALETDALDDDFEEFDDAEDESSEETPEEDAENA